MVAREGESERYENRCAADMSRLIDHSELPLLAGELFASRKLISKEHETQSSNFSSLLSTIYERWSLSYFVGEVIFHSQVEFGDARKTHSIFS